MYQVLYRKWRPQTFSDVSGQSMITAALKNGLRAGRIAHAYLFTGSRGTGKTTCAKILAKAVNCLDLQDGEPCNRCVNCKGIDDGTILDVVEMDAASNNRVDDIRDLLEEVNFTPSAARYRVYIVDEVHMLTPNAANAFLKTLEEPPAHVVFVLATTEVHKLPATIVSRCQRFDFKRLSPGDIVARINHIAKHENFTITEDAAFLIARLADGSMRDALSLLDKCISRNSEVDADVVAGVAGLVGNDYLFELSKAVREKDSASALSIIGSLHESSHDMERLCSELTEFYRNLMIAKSVRNPESLITATPSELERLRAEAGCYELPELLHCIETLQNALERIKYGVTRKIVTEMAVLRLCSPQLDATAESLHRRVCALESAAKAGRVLAVQSDVAEPESQPAKTKKTAGKPAAAKKPADMPKPAAPAADEVKEEETEFSGWGDVLEILGASCHPLYGVLQGSSAYLRGDFVLIDTDNELFKSLVVRDGNKKVLAEAIKQVIGRDYRIGVKKKSAANTETTQDALSEFIRTSADMGVKVDVK